MLLGVRTSGIVYLDIFRHSNYGFGFCDDPYGPACPTLCGANVPRGHQWYS